MHALINKIFILGSITLFVSSCSTLNKDECKTANWKTIGYEDGAKGYPVSRIGQHRSACAEYSISPNLNKYTEGRKKGLNHYCIPSTGYQKGLYGYNYNGVCVGHNEHAFLDAYKHGVSINKEQYKLNKLKADFAEQERFLEELELKLYKKEKRLVSGKLPKFKAIILLNETKEITEDLRVTKMNLEYLSEDINRQNQRITQLKYLSGY